jgi:hypothetical protein
MEPTQELIDEIYRERVLRARRTPIEQKILAGADLFEGVCTRMADGLREEHYVYQWCDLHGTRALLDEIRRTIPPI